MKLHEIITSNENHNQSLLIEKLIPYKKSLSVYYTDYFCSEPILMVTDVFNACQYGKIVSSDDFDESICAYLEVDYIETDENNPDFDFDLFAEYETICFNSISLSKL
jgi:hypothetical protein